MIRGIYAIFYLNPWLLMSSSYHFCHYNNLLSSDFTFSVLYRWCVSLFGRLWKDMIQLSKQTYKKSVDSYTFRNSHLLSKRDDVGCRNLNRQEFLKCIGFGIQRVILCINNLLITNTYLVDSDTYTIVFYVK